MSLRDKQIIGIILIYTLLLAVLLVKVGSLQKFNQQAVQNYEQTIQQIKDQNFKLLNENSKLDKSVDSIGVLIKNIDVSLVYLRSKKNEIRGNYGSQIGQLNKKSVDSLKIIALTK